MKRCLQLLFTGVLGCMLGVTIAASLDQGIIEAGRELWQYLWFRATLADAYFGFLTFYVWVAYKQRTLPGRVLWFLLIMLLGNIAMAVYMLIELSRLKPGEGMEQLLLRRVA